MTTHRVRSKWPIVAVLALTVCFGYWGFAGGCTTAGTGGGGGEGDADEITTESLRVSEATCEQPDAEENGYDINLRAVSSQGRQLAYTSRVITDPHEGGLQVETEVTADGELVMSITASADSTGAEVQIEYGSLVPGMSSASAVIQDGTLTGDVDGREFVPMPVDDDFDAANVTLQDGESPPEHGMDPDLEAAVIDLLAAAATTGEECPTPTGDGSDAEKLVPSGHKNTGHYSETVETGDCAECWAKCIAEGVACAAGVTGGCWLAVFGAPACYAAGYAACIAAEVACDVDCYRGGGGCCPVMCHDNYPASVCCLEDESCLNPDTGRCCGPGETPCYKKYCCEGTEVCMQYDLATKGPNCCEPEYICGPTHGSQRCCEPGDTCIPDYSLCCPADNAPCFDHCCDTGQACVNTSVCCDVANICNDRCCTDEEVCHAGVCCHPDLVCGNVCCDELTGGCIPELSLCCGFDQDICGNTCCPVGESCVGGTECCPDARICGDLCCAEGDYCDAQTEVCMACPNATDVACDGGWCCPAGTYCQPVEGYCCDEGYMCCNVTCSGGCQLIGECLH